ncbi:MAG: hypothetical protein EOP51_25060 [Sphingobacteriales bacterium]|nr:MAG: hypothetical protein EOP51_25060 [Sphingobacteriales bacterium]
MNQLFKLQNQKTWKSLLLTDQAILVVNKSYSSEEEFLEKFSEKGMLKERLEISLLDVRRIAHAEQNNTATITYPKKDSDTDLLLEFVSVADQQQFVQTVAKARQFNSDTQHVSTWKAISSPVIGLAITALFTYITYQDALIIEAGDEVDTSGRRSLYKQAFAWLGENLGTQGTLIAGGAIGLLCAFLIYKNLKSKPVEIVYS